MGAAWAAFPDDGTHAHLHSAIACYQEALSVHTEEEFPFDWALLQSGVGDVYMQLGEMETAATYYEFALEEMNRQQADDYIADLERKLKIAQGEV